jgi:8-amino-7-oxononanoate synthase
VPIVPVIFGNTTLAVAAYKQFMKAGVYVNPVGPPAVPEDRAGFRTSYMASHSWADINDALDIFEHYREQFEGVLEPSRENYAQLAQSA